MPKYANVRKHFNDAMELFKEKNYAAAEEKFFEVTDTDKKLPSDCDVLSSLYFCLSSAARGNAKSFQDIEDICYDDKDFRALEPKHFKRFMTDFKEVMSSVFDYKNHGTEFDETVRWYNGLVSSRLKGDGADLLL